jgi:hypothetical protein
MATTRRSVTFGGLSVLAGSALAPLAHAGWGELNLGEGLEEFWLATDAYIYGYPLVTMEIAEGHHQCGKTRGNAGADGTPHQASSISRCLVPRRDRAER